MNRAMLISVAVITILSGCRGEYGMLCEDAERYAGGDELPPVRIPTDLSVPDEAQALRIPQAAQASPPLQQRSDREGCLESPPNYFEGTGADGAPAASPGTAELD